jgi:hypothetical protein
MQNVKAAIAPAVNAQASQALHDPVVQPGLPAAQCDLPEEGDEEGLPMYQIFYDFKPADFDDPRCCRSSRARRHSWDRAHTAEGRGAIIGHRKCSMTWTLIFLI